MTCSCVYAFAFWFGGSFRRRRRSSIITIELKNIIQKTYQNNYPESSIKAQQKQQQQQCLKIVFFSTNTESKTQSEYVKKILNGISLIQFRFPPHLPTSAVSEFCAFLWPRCSPLSNDWCAMDGNITRLLATTTKPSTAQGILTI